MRRGRTCKLPPITADVQKGRPSGLHARFAATCLLTCETGLLPTHSGGSPAGDAVLSLISSYLGTRPEPTGSAQPPAVLATDGRSPSGGSSSAELRTDARLWEVQWEELAIMRRVGRGSFGSVYLAEWSHTRVAVKVLISKGERRGEWWALYCQQQHWGPLIGLSCAYPSSAFLAALELKSCQNLPSRGFGTWPAGAAGESAARSAG